MADKITLVVPEALDPIRHDRAGFTCGAIQLDNFLKQQARKEAPDLSLTFVLTCREEPGAILGYYTLSSTKLQADDLPDPLKKTLGKYGSIPATLLGRLATAIRYQRNAELRVGEALVIDSMLRFHRASQDVASFGMVVDVLKTETTDPTGFYLRYGFIACTETTNRMYLPKQTITKILTESALIKS